MNKKPLKKPHGRPPLHDWQTVERARDLRGEGWSYGRIGLELGVPWRTVVDWTKYTTRSKPNG